MVFINFLYSPLKNVFSNELSFHLVHFSISNIKLLLKFFYSILMEEPVFYSSLCKRILWITLFWYTSEFLIENHSWNSMTCDINEGGYLIMCYMKGATYGLPLYMCWSTCALETFVSLSVRLIQIVHICDSVSTCFNK